MAVRISISDDPTEAIAFDDDDPTYWFLFPYFLKVFDEVGQMIDLYGDAEFWAEELLALFLVLEKAEADAKQRDSQWTVQNEYAGNGPVSDTATKTDVLECIRHLKEMANQAYNEDKKLICVGD